MTDRISDGQGAEVAMLRARIDELELELASLARTTNAAIAEAQEKLYWLERWHIDLDKVMARPGAQQALEAVRWLRGQVRAIRRLKRRLARS